jgi:DivIVA domain-containing protein
MPLTPEDVVNKRFQPTKFREGYDQDEVDDFLDEIVGEMRRIYTENEDLRQRLLASEARISELQRSGAGLANQLEGAAIEIPNLTPSVPEPSAFPTATAPENLNSNSTNNLLQLARKLHDDHVREGLSKRDALIAEGHATAARVIREAEAQQRVELSKFEQERAVLEHTIIELKTFEREYRLKLKNYIQAQLTELELQNDASTPAASSTLELGSGYTPPQSNQGFFG